MNQNNTQNQPFIDPNQPHNPSVPDPNNPDANVKPQAEDQMPQYEPNLYQQPTYDPNLFQNPQFSQLPEQYDPNLLYVPEQYAGMHPQMTIAGPGMQVQMGIGGPGMMINTTVGNPGLDMVLNQLGPSLLEQPPQGRNPEQFTCSFCRAAVMSKVNYELGAGSGIYAATCCFLSSFIFFIVPCVCLGVCLPLVVDEMKDAVHSCPQCGRSVSKNRFLLGPKTL